MMKNIYENPIADIILNGERLKAFLIRLGTRQGALLSPLQCNSYQNCNSILQRERKNNPKIHIEPQKDPKQAKQS